LIPLRERSMVKLNWRAMVAGLIESELFGMNGAHPGSLPRRIGTVRSS